ncbi:MAG: GDYXXLXY domain-containing protein [Alphaproteobacteria bacterium]|nr:GDYXXLXY domain-containing protein [Alphaproteobacteria bacterium]
MIRISSFASLFHRVPKTVLFGAAALVQLALLTMMVVDHARILRDGSEVTLQTEPVDPRDLLRGDYVVLNYDISRVPKELFEGQPVVSGPVYLTLRPDSNGIFTAVSAHSEAVPVQSPDVLIRGRVRWPCPRTPATKIEGRCYPLSVDYNIEKYFVPEGEGRELEGRGARGRISVVAAVLPSGRAAIKRILFDGHPIYDEPWY